MKHFQQPFLSSKGYTTGGFVGNLTYTVAETGLSRGFSFYEDHDISPMGVLGSSALGGRVVLPALANGHIDHPDDAINRKESAQVGGQWLRWLDRQPKGQPFFAFLN